MLIQSPISGGAVVTIKLITNDEIVAKVITTTPDSVMITKPMVVTIGIDENTRQIGVQMSPYFMLCAEHDSNFSIKQSHIIACNLASDAARSGYIQNTTGLKVSGTVSNGLIV